MTGSEITEICSTAVTIFTIVFTYLSANRQRAQLHKAVNSTNMTLGTQGQRVEQLTAAMTASGMTVPPSPPTAEEMRERLNEHD